MWNERTVGTIVLTMVIVVFLASFFCSRRWRHSMFMVITALMIEVFIAGSIARESNELMYGLVMFANWLVFLWLCVRAIVRLYTGAETRVWQYAGYSGLAVVWELAPLGRGERRVFWLLQIFCAGSILAALTTALILLMFRLAK